jgi:unsaturated chondroitin disaccharide hydrolase
MTSCTVAEGHGEPIDAGRILEFAERQLRALVTSHDGEFPVFTVGGQWHFGRDAWAPSWTGGFLAGQLWILAEETGDTWWRRQAERYSRLIEPRKTDGGTHDLGFLFMPSWGRWHNLHPTEETKQVLIQAGRTLANSFNAQGRYIRTWVDPGSTFIDIMASVDLLYDAAALSGDRKLADIATQHALTSRRFLVRGDYTTAHEGWFDPGSGEFLRVSTHQGYRADSSWVRGHCWAMYGFGCAFMRTGDMRFLRTAAQLADSYMARTGEELVPPNDWDEPNPEYHYEASAASIASAAFLQLAALLGHDGTAYRDYGRQILGRLCSSEFLGDKTPGWQGLIRKATYHSKKALGVQESSMWGDYYFLEALQRHVHLE